MSLAECSGLGGARREGGSQGKGVGRNSATNCNPDYNADYNPPPPSTLFDSSLCSEPRGKDTSNSDHNDDDDE